MWEGCFDNFIKPVYKIWVFITKITKATPIRRKRIKMPNDQRLLIRSFCPIPMIPILPSEANHPKGSQLQSKSRKAKQWTFRYNLITNFKISTTSVPRTGNLNQYQKRFNPPKITKNQRNLQIGSNRNCHSLSNYFRKKNQLQKSARIITCRTTINLIIRYPLSSPTKGTRRNNHTRRLWPETG